MVDIYKILWQYVARVQNVKINNQRYLKVSKTFFEI